LMAAILVGTVGSRLLQNTFQNPRFSGILAFPDPWSHIALEFGQSSDDLSDSYFSGYTCEFAQILERVL
jgi:hypothetical protein